MPKPGFIVEGVMEQRIVQRLCPGVKVVRNGCNGDDVSMVTMAKFAWQQIQLMNNKYFPIVILMDREGRESSCQDLAKDLRDALELLGAQTSQLRIAFVDRSIENWILCDTEPLKELHGPLRRQHEFEEGHCKGTLMSLLPEGVIYHETTLGVSLFCRADVRKMYSLSPSFRIFADILDIACDWLTPIKGVAAEI